MNQFIDVMLNNLDYNKSRKLDITLACIELFRVILNYAGHRRQRRREFGVERVQ
jgi:hypothetical protein